MRKIFIIMQILIISFALIGCKKKQQVATPEFSIKPGIYGEYTEIKLSCKTPNSRIFYTTNGSKPSHMKSEYNGEKFSIGMDDELNLRVIAIAKGYRDSEIAEGKYKVMAEIREPELNYKAGKYSSLIKVMASYEEGELHYTTNGKEPTKSSPKYSDGIQLQPGKTTLKIIAISKDKEKKDSKVVTAEYEIEPIKLDFITKPGSYNGSTDVILSDNANIHYTTDGAEPTKNSNIYTDKITLGIGKTTIRAKRIVEGYKEGEIAGLFIVTEDKSGSQIKENNSYSNNSYVRTKEVKEVKEDNIFKSYGGENIDKGKTIKKISEGYLMIGSSSSKKFQGMYNHGYNDILLIKTDKSGNVIWQKMYGGSGDDYGYSIEVLQDGYILIGQSNSRDIPGTQNNGEMDVLIIKTDKSGNVMWQKMYGGSGDDYGYSITQANDGGYLIAGSCERKRNDVYLLKISKDGKKEWEQIYGGNGNEALYSIVKSSKGGYIACGSSDSEDFGALNGFRDAVVIKINENGKIEWKNFYGGSKNDSANQIKEADSGYVFIGDSEGDMNISSCGKSDIYMTKINYNGKMQWNKLFGTEYDDYGNAFSVDADGYTIAGFTEQRQDSFYIIKMNKQAVPIWSRKFEGMGNAYCYSIEKLDSGYILLGYSNSKRVNDLANKGEDDFLVIKVNKNGESY